MAFQANETEAGYHGGIGYLKYLETIIRPELQEHRYKWEYGMNFLRSREELNSRELSIA